MAAITLPTTTKGSVGTGRSQGYAAATLAQGQVVYRDSNRKFALAKADAVGTAVVEGVVEQSVTADAPCTVVKDGILTGLSGITVGTVYALAPGTAGAIIAIDELITGDWVTIIGVGISISSIKLGINIAGVQKA